jgi:hypothetical protein
VLWKRPEFIEKGRPVCYLTRVVGAAR